jgi:hypothetical protein
MRTLLRSWRPLLLAAFCATAVQAAELDHVAVPPAQTVPGARLTLNGLALRTYSFLRVHIYVAALYLERRCSDPDEILASNQPKLLHFAFLHDVDAQTARQSWSEAFAANCPRPCRLPDGAIERFLAAIPAVRQGDSLTLLFTANRMDFLMNGRRMGSVPDPDFARLILATFIGRHPSSEEVKTGLLGTSG